MSMYDWFTGYTMSRWTEKVMDLSLRVMIDIEGPLSLFSTFALIVLVYQQRWAKWRSSTFYLSLNLRHDRSTYFLRPLEKSRYRARCFFTLKRSLEILIVSYVVKNFLYMWSLILFLGVGNIPEETWSIDCSFQLAKEVLPSPAPHPLLELQKCAVTGGTPPD
jgi:hypothetical protein